jgi:hypothetical protein
MNNMEKSSFSLVFGDAPVLRVVDFLLDNQEFDYSLTDIAKGASVGWTTIHQFWPHVTKIGLVRKTRRVGRAELYKLNQDSPIVQKLIDVDMAVSKALLQKKKVVA